MSERGGVGWKERKEKKRNKTKSAQHLLALQGWMVPPSLLFIQTASLRAALRQYCAHFFSYLFFSFPASCKKMCGSRLFRSDLKRRRPWVGGSESLKNVALVWVDEDQNLLLRESQLLPLLSRLRPFSTTLALATSAFFFQFYCSVPLLIPSCFNPRRPPLPKPLSPLSPSQFLFTRVPGASADFHIPPSWFPCPLACSTLPPPTPPPPRLPSHPFITGPCSVNPRGFCLFVLELLLQLATDPTYFLTSHLNSRAALQLLHQLTYH